MNYNYQKLLEVANSDKNKGVMVVSRYLKGEKYDEDEIKLLVIGRALNGWSKDFIASSVEEFNSIWEKQEKGELNSLCKSRYSNKGKAKLTPIQTKGLEWVKSYIKKDNGKRFYRTENTPFWSVAREITELLHNGQLKEGEWTKHIAWTNLAKIAPLNGGNPNDDLWNDQHDISKEILWAELEKLQPTHIMIIAKSNKENNPKNDSWTEGYYEILESYKNKHNVKIAYMYRPEFKKRSTYISDTKNAFDIN
ncbi:MAG: hypothetical protein J6D23_07235 [Clostridia bacterium]|nr:hypothetical protein [Clostridia bacterium]